MILQESSKKCIPCDFAHAHGVWLRGQGPMRNAAARLFDLLCSAGMHLDMFDYEMLPLIPFWRYDLIVVEQARNQRIPIVLTTIKRVRALSYAPVVVLTRQMSSEFTIDGLLAGADSISSINCCEHVLLAHWRALLRRWRSTPPMTRKARNRSVVANGIIHAIDAVMLPKAP